MTTEEELDLIGKIQVDAVRIACKHTRDPALVSFALMRLALMISIGARDRRTTMLEHRDWFVDCAKTMHERTWNSADAQRIYDAWEQQRGQ